MVNEANEHRYTNQALLHGRWTDGGFNSTCYFTATLTRLSFLNPLACMYRGCRTMYSSASLATSASAVSGHDSLLSGIRRPSQRLLQPLLVRNISQLSLFDVISRQRWENFQSQGLLALGGGHAWIRSDSASCFDCPVPVTRWAGPATATAIATAIVTATVIATTTSWC